MSIEDRNKHENIRYNNVNKFLTQREDVDRGWAWVAFAASSLCAVINSSSIFMSGVLYVALLERYNEGETKTALVGAISSGLLCFAAPVGGILNNRFSCRFSLVLGGLLTGVGYFASGFVPDFNWMVMTAGVVVGLGYGFAASGLSCVVGFYFEKWRDHTLSFLLLCVGVGMFASSPICLFLIDNYGLTWTFVIIGCFQLQMCVLGMLCRPSVIENDIHIQKKTCRGTSVGTKLKSYVDCSVLVQKSYILFLLSVSCWNFALSSVQVHLPNYIHTMGGSSSAIGWVMVSFSIANMVGRILGSFIISKFSEKSLHIQIIFMGISGVATSLFLFYARTPGGIYIMAIQVALFTGCPNTMVTPLSLSFVGVNKLSEAYGFAFFFCGIGMSGGPVIIALVFSGTGSYEYSLTVAGLVLVLGSVCGIGALYLRRKDVDSNMTLVVSDTCSRLDKRTDKPLLLVKN